MYFDFFSLHSQRTALQTASHCMRSVNGDSSAQVLEIIPTLTTTLTYSDRTVVELTCLAWARLSERYRSNPSLFEKVISIDVLKTMIGLLPVPGNPNAARSGAFNDILRVFRSVSKTSPPLGYQLLNLDIVGYFYQILTGAANLPPSTDASSLQSSIIVTSLDNKWQDSLFAILKIIIDLLPPLPKGNNNSCRTILLILCASIRSRVQLETIQRSRTCCITNKILFSSNSARHNINHASTGSSNRSLQEQSSPPSKDRLHPIPLVTGNLLFYSELTGPSTGDTYSCQACVFHGRRCIKGGPSRCPSLWLFGGSACPTRTFDVCD